ncbi:flavin reductase family protein [Streptomyces sp. NBC_01408]|uniref:flavin reductase family protein n=1 Tax=Streptomyces sp. NBC_01408 TaxID=2903855 RepID=UPI00225789B5|nr:flavin reductase family protein [Streptomyces sp. NBC_01408]MCX4692916.1 flavin reductase family protein [Streptomyces sp. NBC_01408]
MSASQTTLVSSDEFRFLMSGFPSGVTVLTTTLPDGSPLGMTCSSLCGVSLDPPVLLVCVRNESPTLAAGLECGTFAVNLLDQEAAATAELFGSAAPDRFDRVRWESGPVAGMPHLIDDAHTVADCAVHRSEVVGDHTVLFGAVLNVRSLTSAPPSPLVHGLRRYAGWPPR